VVSVTGDNSDGPTSTGIGVDGTTSTRAVDSDGGATPEQESSGSRLISVKDSFDIVGGGPRAGASPTRVVDSSERSSEPIEGTVQRRSPEIRGLLSKEEFGHKLFGDKASLYKQQGLSDVQMRLYPSKSIKRPRQQVRSSE